MFTGIVEARGTVIDMGQRAPGVRLVIDAPAVSAEGRVGDSIAINGCCLTIVNVAGPQMHFDAGPETLKRTNLGRLTQGSHVNLERALRVGDRLGGHFVTGHIDGIGTLDSRVDEKDWSTFCFGMPAELDAYLVSKGSIAIDGVSLTVVEVKPQRFSVMLIPHTLAVTTLGDLRPGDPVNLEADLLAKYVQKQLRGET